jgi:hypothetical protein
MFGGHDFRDEKFFKKLVAHGFDFDIFPAPFGLKRDGQHNLRNR